MTFSSLHYETREHFAREKTKKWRGFCVFLKMKQQMDDENVEGKKCEQ